MKEKKGHPPNTFPPLACPGQVKIPTDREVEALKAMRAVKERVRYLKTQLDEAEESGMCNQPAERLRMEEELNELKKEWERWESEWKKAARERMVLLGHEEE